MTQMLENSITEFKGLKEDDNPIIVSLSLYLAGYSTESRKAPCSSRISCVQRGCCVRTCLISVSSKSKALRLPYSERSDQTVGPI